MKEVLYLFLYFIMIANNLPDTQYGYASWYQEKGNNEYTASGEKFDENAMTCAMPHRNFGKYYEVCNIENNKCIVVLHNDYGITEELQKQGRIIDLTKGAFSKIGDLDKGLIRVSVKEVK